MQKVTIGIDLGGTNIHTLVVDHRGKVLGRDHSPSEAQVSLRRVIDNVAASAKNAARDAGIELADICCLGVGAAGTVDHKRGVVSEAPNFRGWRNVPLGRELSRRLTRPVVVENDANVAALGESWLGAGRKCSSMVLVTLGTGIGGGVILDGKIWRGSAGAAGEVGHHSIKYDGIQCVCGNQGCFERYAGASGLVRAMRRQGNSKLRGAITARDVYLAAKAGDQQALAALEEYGVLLGVGLANIVNIFNPQLIVLAGGVTNAGSLIFKPARREMKRRALTVPGKTCKVVKALLPEDAGALGAARLALLSKR